MWGFMLSISKECINSTLLLLSPRAFRWKIYNELDKSTFLSQSVKSKALQPIHLCASAIKLKKKGGGEASAGVKTGMLLDSDT